MIPDSVDVQSRQKSQRIEYRYQELLMKYRLEADDGLDPPRDSHAQSQEVYHIQTKTMNNKSNHKSDQKIPQLDKLSKEYLKNKNLDKLHNSLSPRSRWLGIGIEPAK